MIARIPSGYLCRRGIIREHTRGQVRGLKIGEKLMPLPNYVIDSLF